MLARVFSCAVIGLDGVVVEVEVDTGGGLPNMVIVGLPDTAVQESRERVQSAVKNAGFYYPRKRLTVNLAPASVRKEGPAYDLPIAVGVLIATNQPGEEVRRFLSLVTKLPIAVHHLAWVIQADIGDWLTDYPGRGPISRSTTENWLPMETRR